MSIELYFTFLAAVVLLALTPGPMFALLISNSVSFGVRAGLHTLAGNVLGVSLLAGFIVLGLTSIIQFMADWFDWIKLAGAVYLIWLGITKMRSVRTGSDDIPAVDKHHRYFVQGLLVAVSNPKVLLFLAAFLPQFLSPAHDMHFQLIIYALSFVIVVTLVDLCCVLATGKTKSILSRQRLALFDKLSGVLLMFGGVWLLFARRN